MHFRLVVAAEQLCMKHNGIYEAQHSDALSLNYIMQYDARGAIGLKCVVYNDASTLCYWKVTSV